MLGLASECMGKNFLSLLFVLGGMSLAVHFEQLSSQFDGVPLMIAYGSPVSGKSTAVEIAMAIIGQSEKVGGKTLQFIIIFISSLFDSY